MTNQLILFERGTTEAECRETLAHYGATLINWIEAISTAEVELPPTRDPEGLQAYISLNERVNAVEEDIEITATPTTVGESQEPLRKGVINVASLAITDPDFHDNRKVYGPQLINAPAAWRETRGSDEIIIAVIDTGVLSNHEDFDGRVLPGKSFVDGDDGSSEDGNGHGTHVAGIIGAGLNGRGMVGICPNCKILPIQVLNASKSGRASSLVKGIAYAVEQGARIINLSLGSRSESQTIKNAIKFAVDQGALIVAAAGNNSSAETFYPAAYDDVLAVGAVTSKSKLWVFSNHGSYVDVLAPGELIYSTYHDGAYKHESGTSMAAPHVAGLAGLIWAIDPTLTAKEVHQYILETTQDNGALPGVGLIDAFLAVKSAQAREVVTLDKHIFMPFIMNG